MGFLFAGLTAVWLLKNLLAFSALSVGVLVFALNPDLKAVRPACLFAQPAIRVLASDPLIPVIEFFDEKSELPQVLRSTSLLTLSACDLASNYGQTLEMSESRGSVSAKEAAQFGEVFSRFEDRVELAASFIGPQSQGVEQTSNPLTSQIKDLVRVTHNSLSDLRTGMVLYLHAQTLQQEEFWFIGLQNLSEARATGGIIGNFAIVGVGPNGFRIVKSGSNSDLFELGQPSVIKPLNDAFRILGADAMDWRDLNSHPDANSALMSFVKSWEQVTGQRVSGGLLFGQGVVAKIVALNGGVNFEGEFLDPQATFELLSGDIYAQIEDRNKRLSALSRIMSDASMVEQFENYSLRGAWSYLQTAQDGDYVLAWHQEPVIHDLLGTSKEARDKVKEVYVSFNNVAANKLDRFTFISTAFCAAESNSNDELNLTLRIENRAPLRGLPEHVAPQYFDASGRPHARGSMRVQLLVTVPKDWTLIGFETTSSLDGIPLLEGSPFTTYVLETEIPIQSAVEHTLTLAGEDIAKGFDLKSSPMLNRMITMDTCPNL